MYNKYFRTAIRITFFLGLLVSHRVNALQELDRIVAVVNDDVITKTELEYRVSDYANQLKLSKSEAPKMQALTKQVLERMIRNKIQLQQAAKLGITIDDIALNRMLEKLASSNNVTLEELRSTLNKEGIDFGRFREQTRNELIIQQLQQRVVASKASVTEQEIEDYIKNNLDQDSNARFHLQHILISTPETANSDDINAAKERADKLYKRIISGEKFDTVAIQESSGRNALKGGDLGWRKASELPEIFVSAVKPLKTGETAKPVRSASGFHILKLLESDNSVVMVMQSHARHILIRTGPETTDSTARELLKDIKQKVLDGEDFAKLAEQYSQDPGSKTRGGDLDWTDPGSFVTEFEEVMDSLKAGEISEPFRSQFGWHLLQVIERREKNQTQARIREEARRTIRKRKIDEELRLWLRRIRNEAYVEYIDKSYAQSE